MWLPIQKRVAPLCLAALCVFAASASLRAQGTASSPSTDTPQIERTEPACWAREVPAGETTIEVFFDGPVRAVNNNILAAADPAAVAPEFVSPFKPGDEEGAFSAVARLAPGRVYVLPLTAGGTSGAGGKPVISSYVVLQTAGDPRPEHAPPKVVGIELRQGATPATSSTSAAAKDPQAPTPSVLRITFDRDMNPTTHGFLLAQGDDPITLAANGVVYDKKARTWQATFLARPGIVSVRLNSETNVGFRAADPARVPAWPVQLSFQVPFQGSLRQTATGGGKATED